MALPSIYERTITAGTASGSVEKGVRLQNASFARKFALSGSHTRIGIRFRMYDLEGTGFTSMYDSPRFFFGFCSGTDNIVGDETIDNFAGLMTIDATVSLVSSFYWQFYNASTTNLNLFTGSNLTTQALTVNGSGSTAYTLGNVFYVVNTTSSCDALFFDLIKKDGTDEVYSCQFWARIANTGIEYFPYANFTAAMTASTPSRTGYSFRNYSTTYFSSSTLTYPLDSVCVYWPRTWPVCVEVLDLEVARL